MKNNKQRILVFFAKKKILHVTLVPAPLFAIPWCKITIVAKANFGGSWKIS